jgi:hypothetical protein
MLSMKRVFLSLTSFLLFIFMLQSETVHKTFELGFNFKAKRDIIKGFISEKGSIYTLREGTIFVIDKKEVMTKIENFLKDKNVANVKQAVLYLKNLETLNSKFNSSEIDFRIDNKKGIDIEYRGVTEDGKSNKSKVTQIMVISGTPSSITLKKSEDELVAYRDQYLNQRIDKNTRIVDGVSLKVKAFILKHGVNVTLHTEYWAKVNRERRTFSTNELRTQIFIPYNKWNNIGGSESSHEETVRVNGILKNQKREIDGSTDIMIKAVRVKRKL